MPLSETAAAPRRGDTPEMALRRLRRLLDVCVALNAVRDLDALLGTIARTTLSVLRCEAAAILLHDPREGCLRFAAATGDAAGALRDLAVPLHGSLAGTIFREDRPLVATDVAVDPRHYTAAARATGLETRALLGVPLRIDGEPVGVLQALNPADGHAFDAADVETLLVIAAQAAVALQNARQRDALRDANQRLESVDRARVQFLTIASHELRTPLTALRGFADVLADEVPPDLAPLVDEVQRAGVRMQAIVETVEEMASLRDGRAELSLAPVGTASLLEAVAGGASRPVEVRPETAPGHELLADGPRLQLALGHLVGNALAFTPPTGTVVVGARATGPDVVLTVQDSGRGLAAEHLERVFEPFFQVESAASRSHEGLGVGLTVARSVALKHGGSLWATSAGLGRGSTFHLRLPRAA